MPNYVKNKLEICGSDDEVKEILDHLKNDQYNTLFDFGKIIPIPQGMKGSILGGRYSELGSVMYSPVDDKTFESFNKLGVINQMIALENANRGKFNLENFGFEWCIEWCRKNWGTVWNASEVCIENNIIEFETSWIGLPDLIQVLSKRFPDTTFKYSFSSEDLANEVAFLEFKNGDYKGGYLKKDSKEAFELAFEFRPEYRELFKFNIKINTYSWI